MEKLLFLYARCFDATATKKRQKISYFKRKAVLDAIRIYNRDLQKDCESFCVYFDRRIINIYTTINLSSRSGGEKSAYHYHSTRVWGLFVENVIKTARADFYSLY